MKDYIMTREEEEAYTNRGIASPRLKSFWNDFTTRMPLDLRLEAVEKGFSLVTHPVSDQEDKNTISYNMMFKISDASEELEEYLERSDTNIIICMYDPI